MLAVEVSTPSALMDVLQSPSPRIRELAHRNRAMQPIHICSQRMASEELEMWMAVFRILQYIRFLLFDVCSGIELFVVVVCCNHEPCVSWQQQSKLLKCLTNIIKMLNWYHCLHNTNQNAYDIQESIVKMFMIFRRVLESIDWSMFFWQSCSDVSDCQVFIFIGMVQCKATRL